MSIARRVAWNTVTKWADGVLAGVVQFLLVKFLVDSLGKPGYGLAETIYGTVGFSLIVQLGLRHALGRQLAEQVALKNKTGINAFFSTAFCCYTVIAIFLASMFNLAAPWIVDFLQVPPELRADGILMLRYFASLCAVVSLLEPAFGAVLFANHRFDLLNFGDITDTFVRAIAVYLLVRFTNLGIHGWALGMLIGAASATLFKIVCCFRVVPTLRINPLLFNWESFRDLYSLGLFVFLRENTHLLGIRTDPLIISHFLSTTGVALYTPGLLVVNSTAPFVNALVRQFSPMTTQLIVNQRPEKVQELLIRGSRLSYIMGAPVCMIFTVFAHRFVHYVWLGEGFEITAWVLMIWTFRSMALYAGSAQWPLLMGLKKVQWIVKFQLVLAIINVTSSVLLVYLMMHYGWGMTSVIGVVIPTAILGQVERVVVSAYVAREVGIKPSYYFRKAYLRPNVVLACVAVASALMIWVFDPKTVVSVLTCMAVAAVIWLVLAWFVALDNLDRNRFLGLLKGKKGKGKKNKDAEELAEPEAAAVGLDEEMS